MPSRLQPMNRIKKKRLDIVVVEKHLVSSRSRARDLIKRGLVRIDGEQAGKAGLLVDPDADISLADDVKDYVSRGGIKLARALDAFALDPAGRVALDLGASTGGFVEILLARGARRVYAVDVGHGQLHDQLRSESKVVSLEGRDARALTKSEIRDPIDAITADLSFVSLTKVLAVPLSFAGAGAWLVALIKPQFEVGREAIGKGGIVRDTAAQEKAIGDVRAWFGEQQGWRVLDIIPSPILGQKGNKEFLIGAVNDL